MSAFLATAVFGVEAPQAGGGALHGRRGFRIASHILLGSISAERTWPLSKFTEQENR
jgi:hypothetical protein